MKTIFILLLILSVQHISFAQDIIYKTDGIEIKSKVIELEQSVIKYKNFDQQDGPIRNIPKSQVFMIKFQDGTIEKFTTISNLQSKSIYDSTAEKNPTIAKDIDFQTERAKSLKSIGTNLAAPGALGILVGTILYTVSLNQHVKITQQNMKTASYMFFGISFPLLITGSIIYGIGKANLNALKMRKAELSFQMVHFDNMNCGRIISANAVSMGIRILF